MLLATARYTTHGYFHTATFQPGLRTVTGGVLLVIAAIFLYGSPQQTPQELCEAMYGWCGLLGDCKDSATVPFARDMSADPAREDLRAMEEDGVEEEAGAARDPTCSPVRSKSAHI